jgi:hypothetical protein
MAVGACFSKGQFFSIWDPFTPLAATANIMAGDQGYYGISIALLAPERAIDHKSVLLGLLALGSALVMALHRSRRWRQKCVETLLDDGVALA